MVINSSETNKDIQAVSNEIQSVQINNIEVEMYQDKIVAFSRIKTDNIVSIHPEIKSRVMSINVKKGDRVKKGDLLAELDMGNLDFELTYLLQKDKEYRIEQVASQKLIAVNQISKIDIEKIKSKIKRNEADIASLKDQINKRKIYSPINGSVDEVDLKRGELADTSVSVFQVIGNINKVEAEIHASKINKLKLNQKIMLRLENESVEGSLSYISKNISTKNNTVLVEATLNSGLQYHNLYGELEIVIDNIPSMKIPSSSVILGNSDEMAIFYVKNNIVKYSKIEILKNNGSYMWIKPISESSVSLVTVGQFYIKDGSSVTIGEKYL
jgi:multidrug efflux system membrane fusion protein